MAFTNLIDKCKDQFFPSYRSEPHQQDFHSEAPRSPSVFGKAESTLGATIIAIFAFGAEEG